MYWIFNFILSHRRIFSLLLTSFASIFLITASPVTQVSALRFLSMTIFFPMQIVLSQSTKVRNIFSENRRLKQEVIRLNTTVASLQDDALENKRLQKLLDIAPEFTYELLPVRVIANDPSPALRSVIVNAGKNEKVAMWMPLVDEKGVVGRVSQVMHRISLVQLLKDPSNRTGVLFKRTRTAGILETQTGNEFFIRCRSHEPIESGDTIVTSGMGGIYPRGLMTGTVRNIEKTADPLFKKVFVNLSVDFDHLEELYILRMSPQWSAFRAELDSIEFDND